MLFTSLNFVLAGKNKLPDEIEQRHFEKLKTPK
jgi:hypothetical protein